MVKIAVTGDSIPNSVHEKGLSEAHNVEVKNYLEPTSDNILDKTDNYIYSTCTSKKHHK